MVAEFPVDTLPMIHMISVTEHYAVIIYYPVTVDLAALPSVNFHPMEAMIDLDEPARIYLVDLR